MPITVENIESDEGFCSESDLTSFWSSVGSASHAGFSKIAAATLMFEDGASSCRYLFYREGIIPKRTSLGGVVVMQAYGLVMPTSSGVVAKYLFCLSGDGALAKIGKYPNSGEYGVSHFFLLSNFKGFIEYMLDPEAWRQKHPDGERTQPRSLLEASDASSRALSKSGPPRGFFSAPASSRRDENFPVSRRKESSPVAS